MIRPIAIELFMGKNTSQKFSELLIICGLLLTNYTTAVMIVLCEFFVFIS